MWNLKTKQKRQFYGGRKKRMVVSKNEGGVGEWGDTDQMI